MSLDPLAEEYPDVSDYSYVVGNPVKFIDPSGKAVALADPPTKLYTKTNSTSAASILKEGFNATTHGVYSNYNWFSTTSSAKGTGRTKSEATIKVEGIDVSNAHEITNKQRNAFYKAAKKESGYTSEQIKNDPAKFNEVNGRKFEKIGKYMDDTGAAVYKVGKSYAVSDAVVNSATSISKLESPIIKTISRMAIILEVTELPLLFYEGAMMSDALRNDPNYKGLGDAEKYNYQQFAHPSPLLNTVKDFFKGWGGHGVN